MNTAEMVIKADRDGKRYKTEDMYYQRGFGFIDKYGNKWEVNSYGNLNDFAHETGWEEIKTMTKRQIEDLLGYEIEIISE
jgi:hypothetical protein